ncbi:VCBS repeat-containing protein, partial [Xanthomonas perforans]
MTTRCRWWATVLATTATLAMSAGAATLPAGAARLLPAGQSVMSVASADLTGDGRQDYVVALRASAEQTLRGPGHAAPPRTLLVLVANAGGGFVEAARNTRVIFNADEGGQCDPFLD